MQHYFATVTLSLFIAAPALAQTTDDGGGIPWWGWLLIALGILALVLLVLWPAWRRRHSVEVQRETPAPVDGRSPTSQTVGAATVAATSSGDPTREFAQADAPSNGDPDDLKRIEGIGPKIASVLGEAGITSFAGLAQTDVAHLRSLLDAPKLRMADPTTWPHQAGLAADNRWDELEKLQDTLDGGKAAE